MGQSTSRSREQSSSSSSPRHGDTSVAGPSSSRSNGQATSPPSTLESPRTAEKKKSRRQSMFNLVSRPSTSSSESHSMSLRKRWRSSRRFSKTQSQLEALKEPTKETTIPDSAHDPTCSEVLPIPAVETQIGAGPSHSSRPSTPFPVSRPTTPHPEPPTDMPAEELSLEERQLSENIGNWLSGSPPSTSSNVNDTDAGVSRLSHPDSVSIEREINELLSSPSQATNGGDTGRVGNAGPGIDPPVRLADSANTVQAPPRHFPPPGTLVVVQGVVNTTDAPTQNGARTTNASAPPPPPPPSDPLLPAVSQRRSSSAPRSSRSATAAEGNRRTGLSSLMPRPSSMINRRPSTSSRVSTTPALNRYSEPPSSGPIPTHAQRSSFETSHDFDTATPTDSEGGNTLSPGSIDVLGTLLSVAAAATAASLFSPGFSNHASPNDPSQSNAGRPMSPTPTAGLGGLGGLNRLAELSLDPPANVARPPAPLPDSPQNDRDTRDRLRDAWENFRDRVGLGSRGNGASTNVADTTTEGESESANEPGSVQTPRLRPGELMLAEMARALNAGLGLTSSNNNHTSTDQIPQSGNMPSAQLGNEEERPHPLSPDPGFEAFLTSLQADLRTVLSGDPSSEDDDVTPGDPADSQPPVEVQGGPQHEVDVPADVLPFTDDIESELGSDSENTDPSSTHIERHHARTPTPIPPSSTLPHLVSPDSDEENTLVGDRRRPAINLWRVYRFPPIPAPPGHALRMSVLPPPEGTQDPTTVFGSTTPVIAPAAVPVDISTRSPPSSHPEQTASAIPSSDSNVVVPVIVVGLQSVDTIPDHSDVEDGSTMPHDHVQSHDEPGFDPAEDFGVQPHDVVSGNRPAAPRGRSWQSRAANALRGLRPVRRNGSRGRTASDSAGSRTFLIYVIGGYYPPNHHVVTGSDSLDSYEALWELADLLGQVKPPVATREDIDNSGLEIVKATEMKQREHEGRIASNCMERCLICLDDYDPESDIRVLSCRHAFHKDCVDKWLQVGRNNCPACRSKGVSISGDSAQAPPSPTAPLL